MSDNSVAGAETMPMEEAREQVLITVERMAMLYYHFANTLVAELGRQKGGELISRAIASYGQEVGERHRQKAIAAGYEASVENYKAVPDLPKLAWSPEGMPTVHVKGREQKVCPLAKYWMERDAEELGRLYCLVDQAKYAAFDADSECRHLANVLDGDERCLVVARKKSEWSVIDGGDQ